MSWNRNWLFYYDIWLWINRICEINSSLCFLFKSHKSNYHIQMGPVWLNEYSIAFNISYWKCQILFRCKTFYDKIVITAMYYMCVYLIIVIKKNNYSSVLVSNGKPMIYQVATHTENFDSDPINMKYRNNAWPMQAHNGR